VTVRGEPFKCVNYVEGGVNKFESVNNKRKCPIYTYYCKTEEVAANLEKDYDETFNQRDFDPSSIVLQNVTSQPDKEAYKGEVDCESLQIGHAVVFK